MPKVAPQTAARFIIHSVSDRIIQTRNFQDRRKTVSSEQYKSEIRYAGDDFFIGISPSGHAQAIDVKGDRKAAATPVEMLLMATGACTAADVISILHKKRQQVSDYKIEVTGDRREEHPRKFTKINVHHIVYGHNVSEQAVASAIELSETKYCSVAASIRPSVELTATFEIVETGTPE